MENAKGPKNVRKVITTNNEPYSRGKFRFAEKSGKAEGTIVRLEAPATLDKFVLRWAEVPDQEAHAEAPIKADAQAGMIMRAKTE
ncbi:unnamed protein product [Toxocara canis]|uniref:MSP domain-containing protein n=1 Tax=Toxocara canis TaxID=6265 RepID=A0A183U3Y3_TOXCA|nr:unnamed protein product [Toxocara canis]